MSIVEKVLRTKPESCCTCLDSYILEVCRFESGRQLFRIDKNHRVPEMKDAHTKGLRTVDSGEDSTGFENPVGFG